VESIEREQALIAAANAASLRGLSDGFGTEALSQAVEALLAASA
jgi:hypothetical protein